MSTLRERITIAMVECGISQSELARRVGISSVAVNAWCTGSTKSIKGDNLLKASSALGVNPVWLSSGRGGMSEKAKGVDLMAASEVEMLDELERRGDPAIARFLVEYARRHSIK